VAAGFAKRRRGAELRAWVVLLAATGAVAAGPAARADGSSLGRIVDAVVRHGPTTQLPPHLSMVLGLSSVEHAVPMKQAELRDGTKIHTFMVGAADHADLVLLDYDEASGITEAYRLAPSGTLRKAVSYSAGATANEQPAAKARAGLSRELKFWTDWQARPAGMR